MNLRYYDGTSTEIAEQLLELKATGCTVNVAYLHKQDDGTFSMCVEVR